MENKMTLLYLRSLSNEQAMEWLIKNYPLYSDNYYMVFYLIPHLSWKKKYRRKLAEYYFAKLPFASDIPFTSFLKIMPPHEMLKIIDYVLSNDKKDLKSIELSLYYINNALVKNNNGKEWDNKNMDAINNFFTKFKCIVNSL